MSDKQNNQIPIQSVERRSDGVTSIIDAWIHNLANTGRGKKQIVSIFADCVICVTSLWLAYSLRFGQPFSDFYSTWYLWVLLPVVTATIFMSLGVYRWIVRSSNQLLNQQLAKGSLLSSIFLLIVIFLLPPDRINPRSVFIIYAMLLFLGSVSVRMLWKAAFDAGRKGEPIAIYGAGIAGQQLVRLLSQEGQYRPVLFIDDSEHIAGSTSCGLTVHHGKSKDITDLLKRNDVRSVILAMPSVSGSEYQEKVNYMVGLGFRVLTMPGISEIVSGAATVSQIRDVSISDILGRGEVAPDLALMSRRVTGKTVLVTGGGGSIGSEMCRQIISLRPKCLIILDNCEANLYHITEEMQHLQKSDVINESNYQSCLGSVLDKRLLKDIMSTHKVDTIFHAAAYKHVPIVEAHPDQGVSVNVFGTRLVLDTAIEHCVANFVLISTDKAVRPTNVMGCSKRIAEMVLQSRARSQTNTRISMVRFGNVLGSSGSVVPKFKRQIQDGGPITLTHSEITRYFMTIPEAAQLVLQASAISKGGEVFVLDMGEPVRIEDLAVTMVRLYGKRLSRDTGNPKDIDIVIEGLRHGEKMYEELFVSEHSEKTAVAKISSAREDWLPADLLEPALDELVELSRNKEAASIRKLVMDLAFMRKDLLKERFQPMPATSNGVHPHISEKSAS